MNANGEPEVAITLGMWDWATVCGTLFESAREFREGAPDMHPVKSRGALTFAQRLDDLGAEIMRQVHPDARPPSVTDRTPPA